MHAEPEAVASDQTGNRRRNATFSLGIVALYAIAAATMLWPQLSRLTSLPDHHDTRFSVWRLAWIAHQLPHRPLTLFDANIFYPEPGTLAYSDATLLPGLVATPFIAAGVPAVIVYNLLVYSLFVAAGAAMFWLVWELTNSVAGAWLSGLVFAFAPFRFDHFIHLELLSGFWIPLAGLFFARLVRRRRLSDAAWLGLMVDGQMLSSIYFGIFLVTVLSVAGAILLLIQPKEWLRTIKCGAVAVLCIAAISGPYGAVYRMSALRLRPRSQTEIAQYSASARNYLASPSSNWLYGRTGGRLGGNEKQLFLGITAMVVAVAGLAPPISGAAVVFLLLLLWAVDCSFGANGLIYPWLQRVLPLYQGLRVPARWGVYVTFATAGLAGFGAARLSAYSSRNPIWKGVVAVVLSAAVLLEYWSPAIVLVKVPIKPSELYQWLARQPPSIVLELPVPPAHLLPGEEARYQYSSIFHWQTLVNGYSGYYPDSHIEMLVAMRDFPDESSLRYLQSSGVNYVIVHPRFMDGRKYQEQKEALEHFSGLSLIGAFYDELDLPRVYRVLPPPR
jgi:hypothetical protein